MANQKASQLSTVVLEGDYESLKSAFSQDDGMGVSSVNSTKVC